MNHHRIVMLSGKQGSGKDTLAEAIRDDVSKRFGFHVEFLKFASVIYEIHDFALSKLSEYGMTRDIVKDGPLLQWLGTEWGRNSFGPDVWVKALKGKINKLSSELDHKKIIYVITDCRFINEFESMPEALRVRLICDKDTRMKRCSQWRDNDNHPSETDLDEHERKRLFDLHLDTTQPVNWCTDLAVAQITKDCWMEKRETIKARLQ